MNIALSFAETVKVLPNSVREGSRDEARDATLEGGFEVSLSRSSSIGIAEENAALGNGGDGDGASACLDDNDNGGGAAAVYAARARGGLSEELKNVDCVDV
jgi:hypothetical protein